MVRSSHRRCSVRKGVLRNFAKLSGKHLCQSLFFNKVAVLRPVTISKKQTLRQMFSCEFCVISKSKFFTEHLWATASVWSKLSLFKWWYCWQLTLSLKYYCLRHSGSSGIQKFSLSTNHGDRHFYILWLLTLKNVFRQPCNDVFPWWKPPSKQKVPIKLLIFKGSLKSFVWKNNLESG